MENLNRYLSLTFPPIFHLRPFYSPGKFLALRHLICYVSRLRFYEAVNATNLSIRRQYSLKGETCNQTGIWKIIRNILLVQNVQLQILSYLKS